MRYKKPVHVHTRLTIAKPRGSSRVLFHFPQHKPATYEVNSGEILIFPSQIQHEQEAKTTIWDVFALYPAPELLPARLASLNSLLSVSSTALLDSLFDRVFLMMCCENIVSTKRFPEYEQILAILGQEVYDVEDAAAASFSDSSVDRALAYIEAHLFEELATASIAKAARRSSASLFRDFEKHIGMSPKEYARKRRFEEAALLLHQGQLSVQDVCLMVGYEDVSSFSKAFKSLYGMSP